MWIKRQSTHHTPPLSYRQLRAHTQGKHKNNVERIQPVSPSVGCSSICPVSTISVSLSTITPINLRHKRHKLVQILSLDPLIDWLSPSARPPSSTPVLHSTSLALSNPSLPSGHFPPSYVTSAVDCRWRDLPAHPIVFVLASSIYLQLSTTTYDNMNTRIYGLQTTMCGNINNNIYWPRVSALVTVWGLILKYNLKYSSAHTIYVLT